MARINIIVALFFILFADSRFREPAADYGYTHVSPDVELWDHRLEYNPDRH